MIIGFLKRYTLTGITGFGAWMRMSARLLTTRFVLTVINSSSVLGWVDVWAGRGEVEVGGRGRGGGGGSLTRSTSGGVYVPCIYTHAR